jgi:hypothetical protein
MVSPWCKPHKRPSSNAWLVHLLDFRAALALLCATFVRNRCTQDLGGYFALGRVAYGCSPRPEKCDHFAGPCDPDSQPTRAPRPVLISPRSLKHDYALRFVAGTAENSHLRACGAWLMRVWGAAWGEVGKRGWGGGSDERHEASRHDEMMCNGFHLHLRYHSCRVWSMLAVTKCVSPKLRGLLAASPDRVTNGSKMGLRPSTLAVSPIDEAVRSQVQRRKPGVPSNHQPNPPIRARACRRSSFKRRASCSGGRCGGRWVFFGGEGGGEGGT